jgi:hypothetical protein
MRAVTVFVCGKLPMICRGFWPQVASRPSVAGVSAQIQSRAKLGCYAAGRLATKEYI